MPRSLTPSRLLEEQWVAIEDGYLKVVQGQARKELERRASTGAEVPSMEGAVEVAPDGRVRVPRGWPTRWTPREVVLSCHWRGRRRSTRPLLFPVQPDGEDLGLGELRKAMEALIPRLPVPFIGRVYLRLELGRGCEWHRSWAVEMRLPKPPGPEAEVEDPYKVLSDLCETYGIPVPVGISGRATAPNRPPSRPVRPRRDDEDPR